MTLRTFLQSVEQNTVESNGGICLELLQNTFRIFYSSLMGNWVFN